MRRELLTNRFCDWRAVILKGAKRGVQRALARSIDFLSDRIAVPPDVASNQLTAAVLSARFIAETDVEWQRRVQ